MADNEAGTRLAARRNESWHDTFEERQVHLLPYNAIAIPDIDDREGQFSPGARGAIHSLAGSVYQMCKLRDEGLGLGGSSNIS